MNQRTRTALDFGPLIAWLAAYLLSGKDIYFSTGVAMVASIIALGLYYYLTRRIGIIPAFTCFILVVFGGMTIYFHDDAFVMMKPTLVYGFMGTGLVVSALTGKNILGEAMGPYLKLPPEAWKIFLTRYAIFCFALAGVNEVLRRVLDFDTWFMVKLFGFTAVAMLFMFSQMPLLMKYMDLEEMAEGEGGKGKEPSNAASGDAKTESDSARPLDPGSETGQTPPAGGPATP